VSGKAAVTNHESTSRQSLVSNHRPCYHGATLQDTSSDFSQAWARFQALDTIRLLTDTLESEWTRGRADYLAFLVPVLDPRARTHIARAVDAIRDIPGVEPYPESYWHITIKGAGFRVEQPAADEEVGAEDVPRLISEARDLLAGEQAFEVQIGLAGGFPEVVIFEVLDNGRVRDLNAKLLQSLPGLTRYPIDGAAFLPHVSIARFTSTEGLGQLKDALAHLRRQPPGPAFRITDIQLISAHLSAVAPTFELLASYPLQVGS
jgi:2'-5' RNA ligase